MKRWQLPPCSLGTADLGWRTPGLGNAQGAIGSAAVAGVRDRAMGWPQVGVGQQGRGFPGCTQSREKRPSLCFIGIKGDTFVAHQHTRLFYSTCSDTHHARIQHLQLWQFSRIRWTRSRSFLIDSSIAWGTHLISWHYFWFNFLCNFLKAIWLPNQHFWLRFVFLSLVGLGGVYTPKFLLYHENSWLVNTYRD